MDISSYAQSTYVHRLESLACPESEATRDKIVDKASTPIERLLLSIFNR